MKKLLPLLLCFLFIFSCAGAAKERSLKKLPESDFTVKVPQGWWKPDYTDKYLVTKDGPFLQYVLIQKRPLDKEFRNTRKKIRKGMLPQEVAGIIVDELASDHYIMKLRLIENAPANVDGHAGFKILFSYNDKKGSPFKTLYYGFISGNSFYNIRYNAAQRLYFEKDLPTFEQILSSFKLNNNAN